MGVIDIGSNSVRLVVYRGLTRTPPTIFNEKVLCGLGRDVAETGKLHPASTEVARETLRRFALLAQDMELDSLDVVATAALRQATDGKTFQDRIKAETGLPIRIIDGEEEARLSALGVLSGMPQAEGLMGDLGGGSLELVRLTGGGLAERVSLPIGPLALQVHSPSAQRDVVRAALRGVPWLSKARGPFIVVGGAWRAMAHLHMHRMRHPLPIIHNYVIPIPDLDGLIASLKELDKKAAARIPNFSERRLPTLPLAGMILREVVMAAGSSDVTCSSYGLREGLLYEQLPDEVRKEDPLIAACRLEAQVEGRFPEHADALMRFLDPLFNGQGEPAERRRLRHAACLLADTAWRAHPDFRAERALNASLYGNYVGIDSRGRAMIGAALFTTYGGEIEGELAELLRRLAPREDIAIAEGWGLALRLGQRLTAGTAQPLMDAALDRDGKLLRLTLSNRYRSLYGEVVARRLASLAAHLKLEPAAAFR